MKSSPIHIIRVGMGITFLWVGVLIFSQPEVWGSLIQPWAAGLLPLSLKTSMIGTAVMDVVIGFLLLTELWVPFAATIGFLHFITIITVVGIDSITVRDIGLTFATLALAFAYWPQKDNS